MENINNLICSLIAIQNFCKDIHYNCKGDAFYSKHLLADRVQENINDYIDQIKELCILGNDEEVLPSGEYLSRATSLIPELSSDDRVSFKRLEILIVNVLALIQQFNDVSKGEDDLYSTIAADLQGNLGLINRQIKG